MDYKYLLKKISLLAFTLLLANNLFAQTTIVSGTVNDASTKKPLSYVTVIFAGSSIGANTDSHGKFSISTTQTFDHIRISFVGYKDAVLPIVAGKTQLVNVRLFPQAQQLNTVTIKAGKKPKYRNKGNPAVELIRQVIEHKPQNRPTAYDYVQYKEYDKMVFSFANVSSTLSDKKFFHKYKIIITGIPRRKVIAGILSQIAFKN
jgi:hypothetical protein